MIRRILCTMWLAGTLVSVTPVMLAMATEEVVLEEPGDTAQSDDVELENDPEIASETSSVDSVVKSETPLDGAASDFQAENSAEYIEETENRMDVAGERTEIQDDVSDQEASAQESEHIEPMTEDEDDPWFHVSVKGILLQFLGGVLLICVPGCYIYWREKNK